MVKFQYLTWGVIKRKNIAYVISRSLLLMYLALLTDTTVRYILESNHLLDQITLSLPFDTDRGILYNLIMISLFSLFRWGHVLTFLVIFYVMFEPKRYLLRVLIFFLVMFVYFRLYLILILKTGVVLEKYITVSIIASVLVASIPKTLELGSRNNQKT